MGVVGATSLADALDALAERPEARLLAGGTDLMVDVNAGRVTLDHVVSVARIPELRTWHHDPAARRVRFGAGLTFSEIGASPIARLVPALGEAARALGSVQIRNAATIGGSIGTASPAGDALVVLAALDALVEVRSATATRRLPVTDVVRGPGDARLRPGELIVAIEVPVVGGAQHFAKVGARNAVSVAVVSAAVVLDRHRHEVRVAMGAVGPTAVRAPDAEAWLADALDWEAPRLLDGDAGDATAREFGIRAAAAADPIDDPRASAGYRRHAVGVLCARLARRCGS